MGSTTMEQEKIVTWAAGCDKKPLNPTVTEFVPLTNPPKHREHSDIKKENPISIPKELKPLPEQKTTSDKEPVGPGCGGTRAESPNQYEVNTALHNQAVMLKLTMLQAMTPVKFTGNPSDFPTFRDRMRDNLEDGILTDSQRIEFLPKFLGGEAYDVIERVSGCSYKTVVDILEDRYGQPATVAAACIENLTNGPKLPNTDYTGLRDFAEQLESASKKLVGSYELEASTMTNLKQIVRRLPGYLVNKWADTSYAIREKGAAPKLSDLANLVGVLMRFRQENNTVVADIENFVMTVHIFGAADSPCSANSTLKRLADDNQKDFDPITIETLRRNFYVDDILKSVPTPIFDPLNLAAPAMLPAKQIMQTLWRRKLPWDQPLDGEILEKWKKWKSSLPLLQNFRITRCYFSRLDHEGVRLQLHHFCDASEAAYAGKSRNAPIKSVSIPRLELQGALLAARVDHAIRKELDFKFEKNETRRFQTYVANRITEIRELTSPDQWRHCPGKLNPADDWVDTLRKIAWLLKFIDWLKSRSVKKKELIENDIQKRIGPDDLERSKRHVAILVQRTVYPEEMRNLKEGKRLKASSEILKLKPIMKEDDVMRVGGRISLAPISPDAANPIILPKKHHITTLLIRHLHESNGHCGVEQLLSLLREQFWVVKARVSIKTVLGKCLHCRKQLAPRMHQGMGELPQVRMIPYEPPFTYSGVDYFGPFYVKRGRGRVIEKRWGAIFTCMNSRAVHLEVAKSLETDDFILVLMRFLNRRGQVKELRSDNGTNFVGAEREIRESIEKMDHDKVERELTHRGCKWVFHPPGAAHMSGVWERLVRIVKRSLKAILGNDPMNEEVLNTVFTEAERIANSRPLTRNPSGTDDDEPLTPNHFLNVRPSTNLPPGIVDEKDKFSRKRWRQAQLLANHYWKRWLREYLPSLQVRHKWQQSQRNLQTGAIVLIADDNVPRNQWVLGRVINVFPGADGLYITKLV
ncbi:hypothetical protein QZH41_002282 [Actinostola sp. cb2023]|nr:hypothetical protein QZH41_002282 [Actinostola sp. cb2023]